DGGAMDGLHGFERRTTAMHTIDQKKKKAAEGKHDDGEAAHSTADAVAHTAASQRERRQRQGKARRKTGPRSSHADVILGQGERDALALIAASDKDRLAKLLPVRFTRMAESPFAFFRGSAIVQAHDLQGTPSAGLHVQCCGDCHLMNFGGFATPERALVFDITDFDETLPGPFQWDVKRLAASCVRAGRWRRDGWASTRTMPGDRRSLPSRRIARRWPALLRCRC